jgi:DNA-binding IclR family transcriptional regulator
MVSNILTRGIAAIAVPIRRPDGSVLGAVNIANYGAGNPRPLKEHLPLLLETAARIERMLQSRGQNQPADRLVATRRRVEPDLHTAE